MRSSKLIYTAAAALLLPTSAALAGGQQHEQNQSQQPTALQSIDGQSIDGQSARGQQQQQQQAPEGFILVEERIVYLLGNEPQQHFLAAIDKLAQNDNRGAAAELRIASNYVDMQMSRADEQGKQALKQASEKLNKLADKAQAGELESSEKLARAFAKTNLALAKLYQSQAESALEKDKFVMAGHDLENAATSFRQALVWSQQQPSEEQIGALDAASQVALSLQSERMGVAQQAGDQQQQQPTAETGQAETGQAQPAGAEIAPAPGDPRLGTTPAEAQNIVQHAQEASKGLGTQIDKLEQQMSQDQGGAQEKQHSPEQQDQQQ